MSAPWQSVLDFWFLPPEAEGHMSQRAAWFAKDAAFDEDVRARFGAWVDEALQGGLRDWESSAQGALARVLLLDQFPRNIYRDTPQAYSGDVAAVELALHMIDNGWDLMLPLIQRQFVYLPLMHAEEITLQERCVALYTALAEQSPAHRNSLDFAHRHRDIVLRFGRFPHRNHVLGRASSDEESAFLKTPGSSF